MVNFALLGLVAVATSTTAAQHTSPAATVVTASAITPSTPATTPTTRPWTPHYGLPIWDPHYRPHRYHPPPPTTFEKRSNAGKKDDKSEKPEKHGKDSDDQDSKDYEDWQNFQEFQKLKSEHEGGGARTTEAPTSTKEPEHAKPRTTN